jgi:acetyltransferase
MSRTPGASLESVRALFEPASVAVVGASTSGRGLIMVENLRDVSYSGEVACINPKYDDVAGFHCYGSLSKLPFTPEAVLVAVARERVLPVLREAAEIGAKSAVVLAIGFAEADEQGRELQDQLVAIAQEAGMAILGPNCQGFVNFVKPTALYMDSVVPYEPGRVGFLAQSGSVMTALTNNRRGVRWSHAVSSGNEAVVDAASVLEYFVASADVDVICFFLESIRRPNEFFQQCDLASELGKPIVVMKTGKTVDAQRAAVAHSGALAVPDRLVDALLQRHGVHRADSLEELLETSLALQSKKRPSTGRIAALTASGGQIELILDNLPGTGLTTPPFTQETQQKLREMLPAFLPPKNPLDWWGIPKPEESMPALIGVVAADPNVDIVVQASDFTVGPTGSESRAATALDTSLLLSPEREELFVLLDGVGSAPTAEDVEGALSQDLLVLSGFDTGLRALGHLVDFGTRRPPAAEPLPVDLAVVRRFLDSGGDGLNGGGSAFSLLGAAGLQTAKGDVVDSESAALALAGECGYPVVLKVADESVAHKSDSGGVVLSIGGPDELSAAVTQLRNIGATKFLVQEQITGGMEIFLGLQSEPRLGTFVIVGLGGIWTELLDDVQIRPVGLREGEADEMIRKLRGYSRLTGARGSEPVDLDVLAECILKLDALGAAIGREIRSLDVNPLILAGGRAVAVDALLVRCKDSET